MYMLYVESNSVEAAAKVVKFFSALVLLSDVKQGFIFHG